MKTSLCLASMLVIAALLVGCDSGSSTTAPASASAASGALQLVEVRELVELAEDASRRNDYASAFTYLSEDAVLSSAEPGPDGRLKTSTRTKPEFVKEQTDALAQHPESRYTSEVTDVSVAPDGVSATATVRGVQTLVQDGREGRVTFEQLVTVQRRTGELKVVAVKSTMTGLSIDGTKVF